MSTEIERFISIAQKMQDATDSERKRYDEQKRIGAECVWFIRDMVRCGLLSAENYPAYFPSVQRMLAAWDATLPSRKGLPYEEFCSQPDVCRGLSCCPRNPCCCD
jgi:hypothetical protein